MSGFAADSIDAGYVGFSPAMVAAANKTAHIKIIAQVNKNGSAIVVRDEGIIHRLAELERGLIAIPGHSTIQDFLLQKAFTNAGIKKGRTTIISLKPPEMLPALTRRSIDAFIAWEPYPSMAVTKKLGKVLANSGDIWPDHPCCALVVSEQFFSSFPDQVKTLRKVHLKSLTYIENNFDEIVSIGEKYTGMNKKTIELALRNISYDYRINCNYAEEYIQYLNELNYASISHPKAFLKTLMADGTECDQR